MPCECCHMLLGKISAACCMPLGKHNWKFMHDYGQLEAARSCIMHFFQLLILTFLYPATVITMSITTLQSSLSPFIK